MAMDMETIICPQCGSSNINMESETHGFCESCGEEFEIQSQIEMQNINNEYPVESEGDEDFEEDTFGKVIIIPEYTKDEFIRKAWIQLAKENAPLEVFKKDFSEPSENQHQVLVESLSVDVTYQTSVGYDRQEPYMAYEDYVEKVPYVVIEQQYNGITQKMNNVEVTKYKEVKRQRPVTKYKTVTDWSPFSGSHHANSYAIVANKKKGQQFDKELFRKSFADAKDASFVSASPEEAGKMHITDAVRKEAADKHRDNIWWSVSRSLPGDHSKDSKWNITNVAESTTTLYKAPEYEMSLSFNGKRYVKRAFPFGPMDIGGDVIGNEISPDAVRAKMKKEQEEKNQARRDAIEKNVVKKTLPISLLTIALIIASIYVSYHIRSIEMNVAVFGVAVVAYIYSALRVRHADKKERQQAEDDIAAATAAVKNEIANYGKYYKEKLRKTLDEKLISLGYEPVSSEEMKR